jgi:N,N'-diacetyllegionaminate synthase
VAAVRAAEASLGDGVKRPVEAEQENLHHARRSWHALRDLGPGDTVSEADVALLRPADGIPPAATIVGRIVARPIACGRAIVPEDLA